MAGLIVLHPAAAPGPLLGFLVFGFVMLVLGLAVLTSRRDRKLELASPEATKRALLYALVYGLCAASFARVIEPALLGLDGSPWLLALGDVIFVTLSLLIWVMALAENLDLSAIGFRGAPMGRSSRSPCSALPAPRCSRAAPFVRC